MEYLPPLITIIFFSANIIYCIAYAVRDIFWLRILTIVAAALTYPYFYLQTEPLWSAIFWQSAFLIINLINVIALFIERRPMDLEPEMEKLHDMTFKEFTSRQMMSLIDVGQRKTIQESGQLLVEGQPNEKLYLIINGLFKVDSSARGHISYLKDGTFAGELSYMTGKEASATVTVLEETDYIEWHTEDLQIFLKKKERYRKLLGTVLSADLITKLYSTTEQSLENPSLG